jgi:hypothetical protein
MKTFIEENSYLIKQVFSENDITLHRYMKYPLGEDYYSFQSDDKELNDKDTSESKDSLDDRSKN